MDVTDHERGRASTVRGWLASWPVLRQLPGDDPLARGAARSARTDALRPRTADADQVVGSVCPYCAVGCGQRVYVKDEQVIQIEGDPDSPISRGRLCPKGSASLQLVTGRARQHQVLYRRPYGTEWEPRPRPGDGHDRRPGDRHPRGGLAVGRRRQARCGARWASRSLGGATLDNEENYLIKKLFTALGAIQIENQARI